MAKNDVRSQLQEPKMTNAAPAIGDRVVPPGAPAMGVVVPAGITPELVAAFNGPLPGPDLAADFASRAAAVLRGNALPATLTQARRLLRMALACLDA